MAKEKDIKELLQKITKGAVSNPIFWIGEVVSVDEDTCSVAINEIELSDVRLNAVADGNKKNLLVKPKVGSKVLVGDMSGGELRDLSVLQFSEIDSIIINGGEFGGLIKIEELTKKINELIDAFNKHTHTVATTGTAAAQSGTATIIASPFIKLDKASYENESIKH